MIKIVQRIINAVHRKTDKYKPIRLTMSAIIRWEQLTHKAFSQLDYQSEDDVLALFYTLSLPDQSRPISLALFKKTLHPEYITRAVKDFEAYTSHIFQFQTTPKGKEGTQNHTPDEPIYIKDVVATLIMSGLDADYALNRMELCDLPVFLNAYDKQIKDERMAQRQWAFMQLLPHVNKGTTPQDIYPFAWELEEQTTAEPVNEAEAAHEFELFLRHGLKNK